MAQSDSSFAFQPIQYAPNYIPVETQLHFTPVQYADYRPMLSAIEQAGQSLQNSPLVRPDVRAEMQANVAKSQASIKESQVNQQMFSHMMENPGDYYGQVGFRGAQGMEILPRGQLPFVSQYGGGFGARQNKYFQQNEADAEKQRQEQLKQQEEQKKQPPEQQQQQKTQQEQPQQQDENAPPPDAAAILGRYNQNNPNNPATAITPNEKGDYEVTHKDGKKEIVPKAQFESGITQAQPVSPPRALFAGGNAAGAAGTAPPAPGAAGPSQADTNAAIAEAQQRNQFASADQGVPAGYQPPQGPAAAGGQGAGTAGDPAALQQWQNDPAHQGAGIASAKSALEWAQHKDTSINRAVALNNGPGGSPAFTFYGKHGSFTVPLQQMVQNGFGPDVAAQNFSHVLSATGAQAQQAGQQGAQGGGAPPAPSPQGPLLASTAYNPAPYQQGVAARAAEPGALTADAGTLAGVSDASNLAGAASGNPATGKDLNRSMSPSNIARPGPTPLNVNAADHPTIAQRNNIIQDFQAEANRPQTPVNSAHVAQFASHDSGPTNLTGQDGIQQVTGGMLTSDQAQQLVWNAIHSGKPMQKDEKGNAIVRTLNTSGGTYTLKSDAKSGAPYIEVPHGPGGTIKMFLHNDQWVPVEDPSEMQSLRQDMHDILGVPFATTANMTSYQMQLALGKETQRTHPANWPEDARQNTDAQRQVIMHAQRALDVAERMNPSDYARVADSINRIKNNTGFGGSIPQDWIALQRENDTLHSFIKSPSTNIAHSDADNMLKAIGDPAEQNYAYVTNLKQFIADQQRRYAQALQIYHGMNMDVPSLYTQDLKYMTKHGRVIDDTWNPGQFGAVKPQYREQTTSPTPSATPGATASPSATPTMGSQANPHVIRGSDQEKMQRVQELQQQANKSGHSIYIIGSDGRMKAIDPR